MKRIAPLLILFLFLAGCTGLVAKSDTAKAIDQDVPVFAARVATSQPAEALKANAGRFKFYHDTATVNLFAYLFGPKTILCTATIYGDLQQKNLRSAEFANRSSATSQPTPVQYKTILDMQAVWMANIKRERDGK